MAENSTVEKSRSRRVYIYWAVALGLLLALGLVCWLVVVPVWQVRKVAGDYVYGQCRREEAIAKLGGRERANPKIRLFLKLPASLTDSDRLARRGAAELLMLYNKPPVKWVAELLDDENISVSCLAAKHLNSKARWVNNCEPGSTAALETRRALVRCMPELNGALKSRYRLVRMKTCLTLAELGAAARPALPRLRELLRSDDARVLKAALFAVYRISPERAEIVASLTTALKNGPSDVQVKAVSLLQEMGANAKAAVPALEAALDDPDAYVRFRAVHALRAIGADASGVVPALTKALEHEDRDVRRDAAEGLGEFGANANEAVPSLEKCLDDKEFSVRAAARKALKKIRAAQKEKKQAMPTPITFTPKRLISR